MPYELTKEHLDTIWQTGSAHRAWMSKRLSYFDGQHSIVGQNKKYSDGTPKAELVMNWIKVIIHRYTGAISDIQLSIEGGDDEANEDSNESLQFYSDLVVEQNLVATNNLLLSHALLFGYGIELHSFDANAENGKEYKITPQNPWEWVVVRDLDDSIWLAMRQATFPAGTVYEGVFLEKQKTLRFVYSSDTIEVYEEKEGGYTLIDEFSHGYGRVPVVQWYIDNRKLGIISDEILAQNDEYNLVDSYNGDSVKMDVDSLLKLKGVDGDWVKENIDLIRQQRILPLPPDEEADAEYLSRTFDTERTEVRLNRTRKHIHMMGGMPDVSQIVGTTGATSGIALKLMFTPMQEKVEGMIPLLKFCFRERIDLINAMSSKFISRSSIVIKNYNVTIQFLMPVNRIEEWKSITSLNDVVSHRTQLELLTDIQDPEQEMRALAKESEMSTFSRTQGEIDLGEEQNRIEQTDRQINQMADRTIAGLAPIMQTLSEQLTEAVRSGLNRGNRR